jgi:hypothetical protein
MNKRYMMPLLIFITLLLLLKVYVANELYYTSRNIQKLSTQINALKEERNILKLQIEKLKYKNTIIDPLFNYQPKEPIKPEVTTNSNAQNQQKNQDNKNKTQPKSTKELFNEIKIPNEEL